MKIVDLHTHSTASDGTYSPTELVDYAVEKGLSALALTDHDTVWGLSEAMERGEMYPDLEIIPGIEYSTTRNGKNVHVVGLYIDYQDKKYQASLKGFIDSRVNRNRKMCEKLTEAGFPVTFEELVDMNPGAVITRAHFAKFLYSKGYVSSVKEAFDRYVGDHCPCYVPREKITPQMAVEQILSANGVPVLAHPVLYGLGKDEMDKLVHELKDVGLVGIEALYGTYTAQDERDIKALAKKYDLLISGGSDFHGANKPHIDLAVGTGRMVVPMEVLDKIKEYAGKN
ncbi:MULTISPECIES: PHP domain-containing protein [unclassified Butyrivibrio]|uniref:PHP domain-containing protein n=1 Tax=unclassified Butyrivibrio TaxID=2639466 RepID=UPI00041DAF96|nr:MULTISPECIES: PHP domain-containing protein [unclassified Butyrivibrio]